MNKIINKKLPLSPNLAWWYSRSVVRSTFRRQGGAKNLGGNVSLPPTFHLTNLESYKWLSKITVNSWSVVKQSTNPGKEYDYVGRLLKFLFQKFWIFSSLEDRGPAFPPPLQWKWNKAWMNHPLSTKFHTLAAMWCPRGTKKSKLPLSFSVCNCTACMQPVKSHLFLFNGLPRTWFLEFSDHARSCDSKLVVQLLIFHNHTAR